MNEIKVKKYLDATEERELISRYQQSGDQNELELYNETGDLQALNRYYESKSADAKRALEILVATHTPYVQKVAAKEFAKFNKIIEYEDLVQQGKIGLIKAIQKFKLGLVSINPETNKSVTNQRLLTYAHRWIIAEIQNLFHHSPATHIPAHTIRAILYKVKKPGCNTEERKAMARKAMRAESLDSMTGTYDNGTKQQRYDIEMNHKSIDPTFDEGIKNIFSPAIMKAIKKLNEQEYSIFSMRYGLEHGVTAKTKFISTELGIPLDEVEKTLKRVKRILAKSLLDYPK